MIWLFAFFFLTGFATATVIAFVLSWFFIQRPPLSPDRGFFLDQSCWSDPKHSLPPSPNRRFHAY